MNESYSAPGYHRLAVNPIHEISWPWFVIDPTHFEVHPRVRQHGKAP
jgi:hypothetical protein